jgi:FkbM family methyltransferase
VKRLRDGLTLPSRVRYAIWRATGSRRVLRVARRDGTRLALRPPPTTDLDTAYELYVGECYRCPRPLDPAGVRLVVDLGANVGYSCLLWCRQFAAARVIAYEPMPAHLEQLRLNLAMNGYAGRVDVVPAAAASRPGRLLMSDDENRSSAFPAPGAPTIEVPAVDLFTDLGSRRIDLMKMDIEGAEYALLADPRFGRLDLGALVLEWHARPGDEDGRWCEETLRAAGYDTVRGPQGASSGILWAFRPSRARSGAE